MKTRARIEPTREQLEAALRQSGCLITLDEAMASPAVALALKNSVIAMTKTAPRNITTDYQMRAANDDTAKENHER